MIGIEYCKDGKVIEQESSPALIVAAAYGKATLHAKQIGADRIRFRDAAGQEIASYPVRDVYRT